MDQFPCLVHDLVGQRLHVVGAGPRVDAARDVGLLLNVDLGVAGDAGREVGRQGDRLVERVRVQALRVAERGAHRLDGRTGHVVERVLLGERPARRLRMRAQGERLGIFRVELLHDLGPEQAGGPHLGDFHEVVHADSPEERQPGRERVDAHACVHSRTQILQSVGQRVRQLDVGRRAGFLHMVARNGDRVEFRHVLRRVFEDVGDDLHREFGRVDIGVADHELLEDVVLDRAAQLLERATLL